jgi:hypothetical protein
MHLITGDETGLVRFISTEKKDFVTYGETQSRMKSVLSMQWLIPNETFALLRANGDIETYVISLDDSGNGALELTGVTKSNIISPIKLTKMNENSIFCYNSIGEVEIISFSEERGCLDQSSSLFGGDNCLRGPADAVVYNDVSSRLACGGQKNDLQVT